MGRQLWLADAARATGATVVEVDGWRTRGWLHDKLGREFQPRGLVWHHTAGRPTGDMPSLNTLINGRSDLPGPLAHYGLSRSGGIYVIASGGANHAGTGGWRTLSGNRSVIGIEAEHTGLPSDPWPDEQLEIYRALSVEILNALDAPTDYMCGHKEWTTRKIDPITLKMAQEREIVQKLREEEPMTELQARLEIATGVYERTGKWMVEVGGESAQDRLTRIAEEVVAGRPVKDVLQYFGTPKAQLPASLPGWVLSRHIAEGDTSTGGVSRAEFDAHRHNAGKTSLPIV